MELTNDGRKWALNNLDHSIVARVALSGRSEWPDSHVDAAIRVCNENGLSEASALVESAIASVRELDTP